MIKIKLKPEKRSPTASPEKRKSKKRRTEESPAPATSSPSLSIKLKAPKKEKESKPRLSLKLGTAKKESGTPGPMTTTKNGKIVPRIRVKAAREPGQGYDSEAPDKEDDPLIEEGLILRFPPVSKRGRDDLAYLREAVDKQDYSNVVIRFKDSRRAVVSVRGRHYAAKLVDLPAIVEAQKTFDRGKNMFKCLDVCQMLLVTEQISSEHAIMEAKSMQWDKGSAEEAVTLRHGLTPPLFDAKRRRFRKTVSTKVIESVEQRVTELLDMDDEADSTSYELVDSRALAASLNYGGGTSSVAASSPGPSTASTPAPPRFAMVDEGEMDVDLLDKELERALEDQEDQEGEEIEADDASESEDEAGGESDNSDDDMPRASAGMDDDDEGEEGGHSKVLVDEIADLEATIEKKQGDADRTANATLKERFLHAISKLKHELEVKRRLLKAKATNKEKKKDKKEVKEVKGADVEEEEEEEEEEVPKPTEKVGGGGGGSKSKEVEAEEKLSDDDDDLDLDGLF